MTTPNDPLTEILPEPAHPPAPFSPGDLVRSTYSAESGTWFRIAELKWSDVLQEWTFNAKDDTMWRRSSSYQVFTQ